MDASNSLERALESELGWLRALALKLVADASAADDLVQEALLTALRERPEPIGAYGMRRWLASTLAFRARHAWRSQRRRREREQRAARPEATADASETAALTEAHHALSQAVHALAEPYRSVVLLRYFEGLTPAQIAARHGVPAATVRSQLLRAHEQLRSALDRRHGGDARAWCVAFLPLALDRTTLWRATWLGLSLALLTVMMKPWIALVAALACGVGLWRWNSTGSDAAPTHGATALPAAAELELETRGALQLVESAERRSVGPRPPTESAPPPARLRGRAIDALTRQPLPDLSLHFSQELAEFVKTDSDGRFECINAFAAGRIRIAGASDASHDSGHFFFGQWGADALDAEQLVNWNGSDEVELELSTALFVPLHWSAPAAVNARDLIAQAHLQDPSQGEVCVQTPVRGVPPYARFPRLDESVLTGEPKLLRLVSRDGLWRGEALTPMPRPTTEGPLRIELVASAQLEVELEPTPIPSDALVILRRLPSGPSLARGERERQPYGGRALFGGLDAGEYELDVRAEGFERVVRRLAVVPGRAHSENVLLSPLRLAAAIRGELRTRSGAVSERTTLSLMSADGGVWRELFPEWIERDGRWCAPFEFADLPSGAYQLRVATGSIARACTGAAPELEAPAEGLVLTCDDLAPTARLELELFDARTREPMPLGYVAAASGLVDVVSQRQPDRHVFALEHTEGLEVLWRAGCAGYVDARGTSRTATLVDGVWRQRVELQPAAR